MHLLRLPARDPDNGGGGNTDPAKGEPKGEPKPDPQADETAALLAKLKAAEDKIAAKEAAEAKAKADADAAKAKAAEKEAIERGESAKVIAEKEAALKAATERLDALAAKEKARADRHAAEAAKIIEALPEELRSFGDDIADPERRLEWATKLAAKLAKADEKPAGAGPRGEKAPKTVIPEAIAEKARELNQDPEKYYAALVKTGRIKPVNPAEA